MDHEVGIWDDELPVDDLDWVGLGLNDDDLGPDDDDLGLGPDDDLGLGPDDDDPDSSLLASPADA